MWHSLFCYAEEILFSTNRTTWCHLTIMIELNISIHIDWIQAVRGLCSGENVSSKHVSVASDHVRSHTSDTGTWVSVHSPPFVSTLEMVHCLVTVYPEDQISNEKPVIVIASQQVAGATFYRTQCCQPPLAFSITKPTTDSLTLSKYSWMFNVQYWESLLAYSAAPNLTLFYQLTSTAKCFGLRKLSFLSYRGQRCLVVVVVILVV